MADVKPRLLKGFRDLLPDEALFREQIISKIRKVYESYGFAPISTPALEYKDILLGYGEEASKQIYLFTDPDKNEVGLRYDLTVPISRVMAQYKDIVRPFKRYQIQPVWRYDKPDPGRFREFMQCDIDIIGSKSMLADTEIMVVMVEASKAIGLETKIRFNNRKILNSLVRFVGMTEDSAHSVFRVLDKLDKQGLDNVKLELGPGRKDESGDMIAGLGLNEDQIAKIVDYIQLPSKNRKEALDSIGCLFESLEGSEEGIDELAQIDSNLSSMGVSDDQVVIDFSIARGLDYYTGPIFEAVFTNEKINRVGSIMGGGRYDNLIGKFAGQNTPATGGSIGIDRLIAAIRMLEKSAPRSSTADVLVTVMDKDKLPRYIKIASKLRSSGIKTELYLGKEGAIGKQMKYADRAGIPITVIAGSDEFERDEISIKNLNVIKQQDVQIEDRQEWIDKKPGQVTVPMAKMVETIKSFLE